MVDVSSAARRPSEDVEVVSSSRLGSSASEPAQATMAKTSATRMAGAVFTPVETYGRSVWFSHQLATRSNQARIVYWQTLYWPIASSISSRACS